MLLNLFVLFDTFLANLKFRIVKYVTKVWKIYV